MQRLVIDTDPGVDDAHAIMMACVHPAARVEALTVVAGNVGLARTVENACTILDTLACDVPVYPGCDRGLIEAEQRAVHVHGEDGLGDARFPASARSVEQEHAANALVRMANDEPGALTLVALGPLTNIAVALKLDPALPQKFARLVMMGGAVHGMGNITPVAEFNMFADPEAAHVVFDAWPHFELVDWEATMAHGIPGEMVQRWLDLETAKARFYKAITTRLLDFAKTTAGLTELYAADPLAMAVALEPDIVRHRARHHVGVELRGQYTRGQTVVDWRDRSGQPPNADIVLKVDAARFRTLCERALY